MIQSNLLVLICRACRNGKSPVTDFVQQPGYVMEAYSSEKTKTPGRKNFLLNVSNGDKLGYEISDSVRIRKSFLIS